MLILEDSAEKLNLGDFVELEKLVGASLPSAFKKFYLAHNGGYIENKDLVAQDFVYSIHGFDSVKHGDSTIEESYADFLDSYEYLSGLVPFAFDEGGNNYMLSLRVDDYNSIYLWLHEEEELRLVFHSFEDFVEGLGK